VMNGDLMPFLKSYLMMMGQNDDKPQTL